MGWDPITGAGDYGAESFKPKLGGELYAELSRSGLNTLPVDDYAALALLGCTLDGVRLDGIDEPALPFPVDPDECALRLAADGSVVLLRNDRQDPTVLERSGVPADPDSFGFLEDLDLTALRRDLPQSERAKRPPFSDHAFAQCFDEKIDGALQQVTRLWSRTGGGWEVEDYVKWGEDGERLLARSLDRETGEPAPVPLDAVIVVPNGLGVLYQAQKSYRAIEGILARLERLKNAANNKTIIRGPIIDTDAAGMEFRRPDRDVVFVPEDTEVIAPTTIADVQKLVEEMRVQLELFFTRSHLFLASDKTHITDSRTLWQAKPMLAQINRLRQQLARVFKAAGIEQVSFPEIQLESIKDRTDHYHLLKEAFTDGWITNRKSMELAIQQVVGVMNAQAA